MLTRERIRDVVLTASQLYKKIKLTGSQFSESGSMDILEELRQAVTNSERFYSEVADEAGIDRGQFTHFMNGQKRLSFESAERLANVLGFTIELRPLRKNKGE